MNKKAIVIGCSAGGVEALDTILPHIPKENKITVFVVQHISASSESFFIKILNKKCNVWVKEGCHSEEIKEGVIYFAPPDYHMLIEDNFTISLNSDEKVNFSRPSIDLLFETAAEVYRKNLIGFLLTGANSDGSKGLKKIQQFGGKVIVQNIDEALSPIMPMSALRILKPDAILTLKEIAEMFEKMNENKL